MYVICRDMNAETCIHTYIHWQEMTFDGTYDHHSVRLSEHFGGETTMSVWVKSDDPTRRHSTIVEMGSRYIPPRPAAEYKLDWEEEAAAGPLL
jgi:hypothetical protein